MICSPHRGRRNVMEGQVRSYLCSVHRMSYEPLGTAGTYLKRQLGKHMPCPEFDTGGQLWKKPRN